MNRITRLWPKEWLKEWPNLMPNRRLYVECRIRCRQHGQQPVAILFAGLHIALSAGRYFTWCPGQQ